LVAHDFLQLPFDSPLQVCAPPQVSSEVQPQVPPLQMPLGQSLFWVQVAVWQVPPQSDPVPQSAVDAQALALHMAPLHLPPVPQSADEPHDAGLVQVAPVQVPVGQSVSTLHVDLLHFAPLHKALFVHAASLAQLWVLHFAPLQR
jgi:hypothetical protein